MFAGREVEQLRARLVAIERDLKLDASSFEKKKQEKVSEFCGVHPSDVRVYLKILTFLVIHMHPYILRCHLI